VHYTDDSYILTSLTLKDDMSFSSDIYPVMLVGTLHNLSILKSTIQGITIAMGELQPVACPMALPAWLSLCPAVSASLSLLLC